MEPEQQNTATISEPETTESGSADQPDSVVADPYSPADQKAEADYTQEQNEQIIEQNEQIIEQNEQIITQSESIQTAVETESMTTEVVLTADQWEKFSAWTTELDSFAIIAFNLLLGVVMGYVAVRGFFDAWKMS